MIDPGDNTGWNDDVAYLPHRYVGKRLVSNFS